MDEEQSESYEAIKAAVLIKLNVTGVTYRQHFGLEALLCRWERLCEKCKTTLRDSTNDGCQNGPNSRTKKQISETIVLEQYLCVLHPQLGKGAQYPSRRESSRPGRTLRSCRRYP